MTSKWISTKDKLPFSKTDIQNIINYIEDVYSHAQMNFDKDSQESQ